VIHRGSTPHGRGNAKRDRERHGDDHRRRRELDGGGHALEDCGRHRLVGPERTSQVAAQRALEKPSVLLDERTIETEARSQFRHVLRRCRLAEHRLRRIAGNEVNEREDEGRDAEQYRDRQRDAPRQKPKQTSALCFVLVRAEHILRDCHVVERKSGIIERVLRIGVAMGIGTVLDGTFFQILIDL
jgi:hypothetical protein